MNDSDTANNDFEYARKVKHDLLNIQELMKFYPT